MHIIVIIRLCNTYDRATYSAGIDEVRDTNDFHAKPG